MYRFRFSLDKKSKLFKWISITRCRCHPTHLSAYANLPDTNFESISSEWADFGFASNAISCCDFTRWVNFPLCIIIYGIEEWRKDCVMIAGLVIPSMIMCSMMWHQPVHLLCGSLTLARNPFDSILHCFKETNMQIMKCDKFDCWIAPSNGNIVRKW